MGLVDVVNTHLEECGAYLVMGLVDVVDTPVEQFFRAKHLLILV